MSQHQVVPRSKALFSPMLAISILPLGVESEKQTDCQHSIEETDCWYR
ncbi:MAG: hypothetical protein ACHBN1_35535 [Heteroscytonema crispum UTEX LB 1556]